MKLSYFLTGLGVGAAAAYLLIKKEDDSFLSPKKILDIMKKDALKNGQSGDSWLCEFVEKTDYNGETVPMYQGGIIQKNDGISESTTYLIHAKTGEILDISIA